MGIDPLLIDKKLHVNNKQKKKFDELKSYEDRFMKQAKDLGVDKQTSEKIFKMIVDSGLYSFNESHAVAYALLAYATAYYKVYYPTEFMAAELTNIYTNTGKDDEKLQETIKECRRLGIKFLPVDINLSNWEFYAEEENQIRLGFCCISSFGEKAAVEVLNNRPFSNIEDLIERTSSSACGKRALVPLMLSGAFGDRTKSYEKLCELREEEVQSTIRIHNHLSIEAYANDDEIEELLLGYAYTTSKVNNFTKIGFENKRIDAIIQMDGILTKVSKFKRKKDNAQMAYATFDTADGAIEGLMWPNIWEKYSKIKKGNQYKFTIRKKDENKGWITQVS